MVKPFPVSDPADGSENWDMWRAFRQRNPLPPWMQRKLRFRNGRVLLPQKRAAILRQMV